MKKIFTMIAVIMILYAPSAYSGWQGPVTMLQGGWGSEVGKFGIEYSDSGAAFPRMVAISSSGKILIGDELNKRIQIFKANGTFSNLITPKGFPAAYPAVTQWPLSLIVCNDSNIYTRRNEYLQIYNFDGDLIQNFTNIRGGIVSADQQCNFYTYIPLHKQYSLYSPTGQLIRTSTERPLELGAVKSQPMGQNNVKITITYPDRVYGLTADREFVRYVRDVKGFVYGVNAGGAWRFNQCGKMTGAVLIPAAQITTIPSEGRGEPNVNVHEEYGEPVIASNGDVYTWKRTPDKYSILKWTWVDDPNAPADIPDTPEKLTLRIASSGINLFWLAVPQDPGCVTGYEIARSTNSGGQYSTLTKVNAGTANARGWIKYTDSTAETGTTYYYKVRTAGGTGYSSYTAEVSGKR